MLFEIKDSMKELVPIDSQNSVMALGQNEKNLEQALARNIGDTLFPEYFVFGHERSFKREPDIFALDNYGNLVIFELKVAGEYDRGKIYQALDYAQSFSIWQYADMNEHFKKCFPERKQDLKEAFAEQFGFVLAEAKFNTNQKIIVISHGSSAQIKSVSEYWKRKGIDIEEYFYRIYDIQGKQYFELSNELYFSRGYGHCWINTCKTHIPEAYLDMVKNAKASAYGDKTYHINEALKGAIVLLYHNGYGIVGAGIGSARILAIAENEEQAITLKDFVHGVNIPSGQIEKYIAPAEIKDILGQDFWFAKTKVSLNEEQAKMLYAECKKRFV